MHVVRSDAFAGVERYIATVAGALDRRGVEVTVIGGDPERMASSVSGGGVVLRPAISTADAIRRLAQSGRAEVVHAHMTAAETAAVVTLPAHRASLVCTRHFATERGVPRLANRFMCARFDAEIGISEFVRRSCPSVTDVIPNGVPIRPAVPSTAGSVLVAQRLEPEKRTSDAVHGWHRSGLWRDRWRLVIAGSGSERALLERLSVDLGIDHSVRFLGARSDVDALRSDAGFQIAPGAAEGFGLSVAEAMAAGLPVLAAAGGGHTELLGSEPDLLYPAGDHDTLGRAMRAMAERSDRQAIGARLQQIQRARYSIEAHVDALLALYRRVMA